MSKLTDILSRFLSKPVPVRPAVMADMQRVIELAHDMLVEKGKPMKNWLDGLEGHFYEVIMGGGESMILLAEADEEVVGMMCCGIVPSSAWNTERSMGVWLFYVEPIYRNNPNIAFALMRAGFAAAQNWGIESVKIEVDAEDYSTMRFYLNRLGFEPDNAVITCSLPIKGGVK